MMRQDVYIVSSASQRIEPVKMCATRQKGVAFVEVIRRPPGELEGVQSARPAFHTVRITATAPTIEEAQKGMQVMALT
jgi:hypothetical protein